MSNIVELKTRTQSSSEEAISLLEYYLELAKEGEIISVAIAGVGNDGASWTNWSQVEHTQTMIGAIEILKHKLITTTLE